MNLLSIIFAFAAGFGLLALPLGRNFYFLLGLLCLTGATLLRCLSMDFAFMAQAGTALDSIGVASIFAGTMKVALLGKGQGLNRSTRFLIFMALFLLLVLAVHNIARYSELTDPSSEGLMATVNPWGIFRLVAVFCCFLYLKFRPTPGSMSGLMLVVSLLSITFIAIDAAVYLGMLSGNTEKFMEGVGGLAPANLSTNDAAILATALLIWHAQFFFFGNGSRVFHGLIGLALLLVIAITKSRTGLFCAGISLLIFGLQANVGGRFKLLVRATVLMLAVLGGSFALQIIQDRNSSESVLDRRYDHFELSSGLSGSGRALIWFEYISSYADTVAQDGLAGVFGVGQFGLVDLYGGTVLVRLGYMAGSQMFLPIHSDLLALVFSGGAIAILYLVAGLIWVQVHRKYLSSRPVAFSAFLVLVFASVVDMLQYQPGTYTLLFMALFFLPSRQTEGSSVFPRAQ